jgi:hypothetical protein
MKKSSREWIDAAKIMRKDINAVITCPECREGHLKVKDELITGTNQVDRYMVCDTCGKWNVMTFESSDLLGL